MHVALCLKVEERLIQIDGEKLETFGSTWKVSVAIYCSSGWQIPGDTVPARPAEPWGLQQAGRPKYGFMGISVCSLMPAEPQYWTSSWTVHSEPFPRESACSFQGNPEDSCYLFSLLICVCQHSLAWMCWFLTSSWQCFSKARLKIIFSPPLAPVILVGIITQTLLVTAKHLPCKFPVSLFPLKS